MARQIEPFELDDEEYEWLRARADVVGENTNSVFPNARILNKIWKAANDDEEIDPALVPRTGGPDDPTPDSGAAASLHLSEA